MDNQATLKLCGLPFSRLLMAGRGWLRRRGCRGSLRAVVGEWKSSLLPCWLAAAGGGLRGSVIDDTEAWGLGARQSTGQVP